MRLQQRTDYALRLLIQMALAKRATEDDAEGGVTSVRAVAESYGISAHHLLKVAQRLRDLGYLETVRGRRGGFVLAADPRSVRVGQLVRELEDLEIVECFTASGRCAIDGACVLSGALRHATAAFVAVLDDVTLSDLVGPRRALLVALRLDRESRLDLALQEDPA